MGQTSLDGTLEKLEDRTEVYVGGVQEALEEDHQERGAAPARHG